MHLQLKYINNQLNIKFYIRAATDNSFQIYRFDIKWSQTIFRKTPVPNPFSQCCPWLKKQTPSMYASRYILQNLLKYRKHASSHFGKLLTRRVVVLQILALNLIKHAVVDFKLPARCVEAKLYRTPTPDLDLQIHV